MLQKVFILSSTFNKQLSCLLSFSFTHREDQVEDEKDVLDNVHSTRLHDVFLSLSVLYKIVNSISYFKTTLTPISHLANLNKPDVYNRSSCVRYDRRAVNGRAI